MTNIFARAAQAIKPLKILFPIFMSPMAGIKNNDLAKAAHDIGILPALPTGYDSPEKVLEDIADFRTHAGNQAPVNINIFISDGKTTTSEQILKSQKQFAQYNKLAETHNTPIKAFPSNLTEQHVTTLLGLKHPVLVVSFTFGVLNPDYIKALKQHGTKFIIGTATSGLEATLLAEAGCNMICVQNKDAGGHQGTFLENREHPDGLPGLTLMHEVSSHLKIAGYENIPLIYAGGVHDGQSFVNAFKAGASIVQIGSCLIPAIETGFPDFHKRMLFKGLPTISTTFFTGRKANAVGTKIVKETRDITPHAPFPTQSEITKAARAKANKEEDVENACVWTNNVELDPKTYNEPAAEIVGSMINEVEEIEPDFKNLIRV